jgi:hypothetical protein
MRVSRIALLAVLVLAVATLASLAKSQDKKPAAAPDMQAEMAAWAAYMKPGPEHQQLKEQFEGTWDTEVKHFMGGTEEVSKGTSVNKMMLGGRYLQQMYDGFVMGQPFQGIGYTGYDNAKKRYFGTWLDTMGTGVMVTEGTYDAATKTYTFTGNMVMPDGATPKMREVILVESNDHHHFDMFMTGPDGKEQQVMSISYNRKK